MIALITAIPGRFQVDGVSRYLLASDGHKALSQRRLLDDTGQVDALTPDYIVTHDMADNRLTAREFPGDRVSAEEWVEIKTAIGWSAIQRHRKAAIAEAKAEEQAERELDDFMEAL